MSSQSSSTPSIDSDTREKTAELGVISQDSGEEFVDLKPLENEIKELDSETSLTINCVPGDDCEEWKPVDYCGTMTRPLAYFGNFKVKPETKELPWISDNTSGKVHEDMRTISMLFNESLTLPKEAENFIAQSAALKEEARWERIKAAFYSFYPDDTKKQAFEVLSKMSPRDASRIIAKKTSRFENEIILIRKPNWNDPWIDSEPETEDDPENCTKKDAVKLNKELPEIAREYESQLASIIQSTKSAHDEIAQNDSYENTYGDNSGHVGILSRSWTEKVQNFQNLTKKCSQTRLLGDLDLAVARYEPRTECVHLKVQLLRSGSENSMLPKVTIDARYFSDCIIKGTPEAKRAAITKQMEYFEHGLRDHKNGIISKFDFYFGDPTLHEFWFRVPYQTISPQCCLAVIKDHFYENMRYFVVSSPHISGYDVSHHEIKVYIEINSQKLPVESNSNFRSTLKLADSSRCCLNCFSRDHLRWECPKPEFGFACVRN